MPNQDLHSSEQELLLYADGELPSRDAGRVRAHLAACWECRARMSEIESTIADFVRVHRQTCEPVDDGAGPRALLKARMGELARSSGSDRWRHLRFALDARGLACVCAMALLAAVGIGISDRQSGEREGAYAGRLPIPSLTPGSIRQVTLADLCSTEHDEVVRTVPDPLRRKVFQEYGIPRAPARDYEVDYLITPGLGGADDIRNLWPEPHDNVTWNSYVKDQLEDHLHQMVCNGDLSLAEAQHEIASNWISAYKKYFHSDRPLPMRRPQNV
jgi:Putative zinc-finger